MKECKNCGKEIDDKRIFCSYNCRNKFNNKNLDYSKISKTLKSRFELEYENNKKHCKECLKELPYDKRHNTFCNNICSSFYNNRELKNKNTYDEIKKKKNKKISESLIGRGNGKIGLECQFCGEKFIIKWNKRNQKFCSISCSMKFRMSDQKNIEFMRKVGQNSSYYQYMNRRSKNESYFSELCKKEFENVSLNEQLFNGWDADVILQDYKIAILWNGNWHHKKICKGHSLEQVQNRDKIKIKEIENCGYISYVINDYGKYDRNFVEKEFMKLNNLISRQYSDVSLMSYTHALIG